MKFKTRTIIEITNHSVRLFQASLKGNHPLNFAEFATFENPTDKVIIESLSNTQKNKHVSSFKHSEVFLVVARQYVILRYLDLPSENLEELKAMVELQAVKEIPYSREEIVVDFVPLGKNSEGYTKVLVVAVPNELVFRFIKILEELGVKPYKILPSFIGLSEWYRSYCHLEEGVSVLLDIDSYQSEICICDQNKIYASRSTNFGVKEINLQQYDDFLKQLDWTISSYVKEQLGPPPSQILLVSSINNVEDLFTKMQSQYTTPVKLLRSLKDVPSQRSFVWSENFLKEGFSITAALGLLASNQESAVDLIPFEIKSKQTLQAKRGQSVRLGISTIVALLSIGFCLSLNFLKQNTYLSKLENKVEETKKEVSGINHKIHQVNELKSVIEGRIILIDVIDDIYHFLPQGVVLTNLTLNQEHSLSFQGFANKASDINDMQKGFVTSTRFDNVNLDYVNKRVTLNGELNYFKITCQIKVKGKTNEEAQ